MASVSGRSRGAVYEAVGRLESEGLAASVPHVAPLVSPTRRYFLTADGLHRLARDEGMTVDELLRRCPVSEQARRLLMERLDAAAAVYRLASAISNVEYPVRFRWYRAMAADAAISLPDGRTVAVVRQGLTADRTAFAKRLWRLREEFRPSAVLVLVPDEIRLRHVRRIVAGSPSLTFLALEREGGLSRGKRPHLARSFGVGHHRPADGPGPRQAGGLSTSREAAGAGVPPRRALAPRRAGRCAPLGAPRVPEGDRQARPRSPLRLALDGSRTPPRAAGREAVEAVGGAEEARRAGPDLQHRRRGRPPIGALRPGAGPAHTTRPHVGRCGEEAVERRARRHERPARLAERLR